MKVGIYQTVEVDDVQRALIAKALGQGSASRDDMKAYIWSKGEDWALHLSDGAAEDEPDEDLLGGPSDGDEESLI